MLIAIVQDGISPMPEIWLLKPLGTSSPRQLE